MQFGKEVSKQDRRRTQSTVEFDLRRAHGNTRELRNILVDLYGAQRHHRYDDRWGSHAYIFANNDEEETSAEDHDEQSDEEEPPHSTASDDSDGGADDSDDQDDVPGHDSYTQGHDSYTQAAEEAFVAKVYVQKDREGISDCGATASLMGEETLEMWKKMYQEMGLDPDKCIKVVPGHTTFRFGNSKTSRTLFTVELFVKIFGLPGFLKVHVVKGSAPLLIARDIMKQLKMTYDFDNNCAKSKVVDNKWHKLKEASNGHLLINLTDFRPEDNPTS